MSDLHKKIAKLPSKEELERLKLLAEVQEKKLWFHGFFLNHMMYEDALFKIYYDYLEVKGREDLMLILPPRQMKPANEEWVSINEE